MLLRVRQHHLPDQPNSFKTYVSSWKRQSSGGNADQSLKQFQNSLIESSDSGSNSAETCLSRIGEQCKFGLIASESWNQ